MPYFYSANLTERQCEPFIDGLKKTTQKIILVRCPNIRFINLFHGYLCSTAFVTHENNIIISLSDFRELLSLARRSIQRFDNDYGIIFMGSHSVGVNYK